MSIRIRSRHSARHHARTLLLPALAIMLSLGLAACGGSSTSSSSSTSTTAFQPPPIPAGANSSPEATVKSYLGALSDHDVDLARRFIAPTVRKTYVAAQGSGFSDLTTLADVKVLALATGPQYKPKVSGVSFSKYRQFAQVTVSYSVTFSSSKQPSGPQKKLVALGENAGSKWLIVGIKPAT